MLEDHPEIKDFLHILTVDFEILLGDNLEGIYLTGSLTTNSYIEKLSDIDLIVVLKNYFTKQNRMDLDKWAKKVNETPFAKNLDIAFIDKHSIRSTDGKTQATGLEFWKGNISEANNTLGDNLLVWASILSSGIKLYGVEPREIIGDIPHEHLKNAMLKELRRLREIMNEVFETDVKFRYYMTSTLCRMQYTNKMNDFVSKKAALEWYIGNSGKHENLIEAAKDFIEGNEHLLIHTKREDYNEFIEETEKAISNET